MSTDKIKIILKHAWPIHATGIAGSGFSSKLTAGLREMSAQGRNLDALEIDALGRFSPEGVQGLG